MTYELQLLDSTGEAISDDLELCVFRFDHPPAVPRIGESVHFGDDMLKVVNVVWTFYPKQTVIGVTLEPA